MSKAILVIDMPENCLNCPLADWANCRIIKKCHTGHIRPNYCPLRHLPEKKEEVNLNAILEVAKDKDEVWQGIFMSYMIDGYNACIDEIGGGTNETDKETHQSP